jgi:hypothetical protein
MIPDHFRVVTSTHALTRVCRVQSCTSRSCEPCRPTYRAPRALDIANVGATPSADHCLEQLVYIFLSGDHQGVSLSHHATKIRHFRRSPSRIQKRLQFQNISRSQQHQQSWAAATLAPTPTASAHAEVAPANNVGSVVKNFENILTSHIIR